MLAKAIEDATGKPIFGQPRADLLVIAMEAGDRVESLAARLRAYDGITHPKVMVEVAARLVAEGWADPAPPEDTRTRALRDRRAAEHDLAQARTYGGSTEGIEADLDEVRELLGECPSAAAG